MAYEKGHIRSDRGLFLDKGNHRYDPRHPDFGADEGGLRDTRRSFADCDAEAVAADVGCFVGPGSYLISSNLTLSADWTLARGVALLPASGVTITFSGAVRGEGVEADTFDTSLGGSFSATNKQFGLTVEVQAAPIDASYVTLGTNATLANERVLTGGTGISVTDGGAGSAVTIDHALVAGTGISIVGDTISTTGASFDPIANEVFS